MCCFARFGTNFTRHFIVSITPLWVFFTFCKLYKWYKIAESVTSISHVPRYFNIFQNQPPGVFCKKGNLKNFEKIHRKTHVLESLFNKAAGLQPCNFIKKRFQQICEISKNTYFILKNICKRLLLKYSALVSVEYWNALK